MSKVIEIIVAWFNLIFNRRRQIAKERYNVCKTCPYRDKVDLLGGIEICGLCSCPLKAKTHSPKNSCDAKKWSR